VPLIFGENYQESVAVILILCVSIPIRFVATSVGGVLVTRDLMRHKVWYHGFTALLNILLNILLIPKYSFYGAAASTVISEIFLLIIYLYAVNKKVFGVDAYLGWKFGIREWDR
jgi:O-antigen/teichoic acid export membrane protein